MDSDYGFMLRNKYPAINAVASITRLNDSQYYDIQFYNQVHTPSVSMSPNAMPNPDGFVPNQHIDGMYFFEQYGRIHYGIKSSNTGVAYDYTLGWYDEIMIQSLDFGMIVDEVFRLTHFPIQPKVMEEIKSVYHIRMLAKSNLKNVHNELLILPPNGNFMGGSIYHDAKDKFYAACAKY